MTAGHIYYQETDITELKPDRLAKFRKENLGFVFQDYNLLDTLTIGENIVLAMTLQKKGKKEIKKESEEMMRLLGIWEIRNQFPYQVSGGQKQRCACARALINHPKLLLADEPTGALDSRAAETLLETFQRLNETRKATIFMVTHDAFSASYCSRILFLKDGKIFHELVRGQKGRREFLNSILDVLSVTEVRAMLAKLALRNVRRSAKDYLVYFFTMTVVVALMFAFNSLIFSEEVRDMFQEAEVMEVMLGLATFFIVLIVAWLINYMIRFILEKRSREFGIYLLLGMEKWQIARLYMRESVLLGAGAFCSCEIKK